MKNIITYLTSRLIKIVANILKGGCYIFHFFFPRKRFVIPSRSSPFIRTKSSRVIPKIIWQTNYTDRVTLAVYMNYLFNRLMATDHEYRFMTTAEREAFVRAEYPQDIFENYSKLQIGAAQADFWRVLILQKYGGIYLDIDAHLIWPLSSIINPDHDELYISSRRGNINNYFIASKHNSVHLEKIINLVMKNINENKLNNVYDLTGPGVFNAVLDAEEVNTKPYRYVCNQGNFTNEYFQYIDKTEGKWTKAQNRIEIIKK
ncbi:MAG: glycosyl transferase [Gammaproteobacteria bacterium]|nr:glycosyl transferase [Gammaproteobacteria bacterium]